MPEYRNRPYAETGAREIDEGLRSYMLKVYNYMALGVALTGAVAWFTANSALMGMFYTQTPEGHMTFNGMGWLVALAPLGFVLAINMGITRMKTSTVQTLFWAFAAVMGLSLSSIFAVYTGVSIARVFFITAATFGGMSLYGYTTRKDLSSWGSFLFMGLLGIILASLVNIFLQSAMMHFVVSVAGVLIFTGLTAYDTQKIRRMYSAADGAGVMTKKAISGALSLYLDFINLFLMLMRFMGDRR